MKATAFSLAMICGFLRKIEANIDTVEVEVYFPDILEMDLEMFNSAGINLLKGRGVGDMIKICEVPCKMTLSEGITIKIK